MAIGDITKTQLVDHEFDSTVYVDGSICHIASTYYAVAYKGPDADSFLKTFNIATDGTSISEVDSWEFDTNTADTLTILKVGTSNYYAIFGEFDGNGCKIKTVQISDTGIITESFVDTEIIESGADSTRDTRAIAIPDTDYYVVVHYSTTDSACYFRSFEIDPSDGSITTEIDNIQILTLPYGHESDLKYVDNGIVVCVSHDGLQDGHLVTFRIDTTDGSLSSILENNTAFSNASTFRQPGICVTRTNVVAFAWSGVGTDGFLQTASIDTTDGSITLHSQIEFDTTYWYYSELTGTDYPGLIFMAGRGNSVSYPSGEGTIYTYDIGADGSITQLDKWEVSTTTTTNYEITNKITLLYIGDDIWVCLSGQTTSSRGHLFTFGAETAITPPTLTEITRSSLLDFYTFEQMDSAVIQSVSSETTAHPAEHAIAPLEPNFAWETNESDVKHTITIDLGETKACNGFMFIHNESVDIDMAIECSPDNSDWTSISLIVHTPDDTDDDNVRLKLRHFADSSYNFVTYSARYWRFTMWGDTSPNYNAPNDARINAVWLFTHYQLDRGYSFPLDDTYIYPMNGIDLPYGKEYNIGHGVNPHCLFSRTWMLNTTQYSILKQIMRDCNGGYRPFVIIEPDSTRRLCKFEEDIIDEERLDINLWRVKCKFVELPMVGKDKIH